jgi:hypothetical protein
VLELMERAGLEDVRLAPVNQMSWSAIGIRPPASLINEEPKGVGR